ncbi:MAG: DASH family cryptochrome [Rhodothermales bacterium]
MLAVRLVWLRNDLRLHDHEALADAARDADQLIPLYCFDPRQFGETRYGFDKTGPHRALFLLESLEDLRQSLQAKGLDLVVRRGKPEEVISELVREHGVEAVHFHHGAMSEETDVEKAVEESLEGMDVRLETHWGHTLYHIDDIPFSIDDIPDVFGSFRRGVERQSSVRDLIPTPKDLAPLPEDLDAGAMPSLADLGFETPEREERAAIRFHGGETRALERLNDYVWTRDRLKAYKATRNGLLGEDYSSKFSPWLAHGCLSPRKIYREVKWYEGERVKNKSTYWMVFEIIWRDFFRFIGLRYGDRLFATSGPLGRDVRWSNDREAFERWASGTTGFPFIDANMREMNRTGFMSNRGRQNVASFLTRNLQIDWRLGAAYFETMLVDYDVTSNWGNWAYNAGIGHDPRNRYFNILSQAQRYDAEAEYVKHWLPELRALPPKLAQAPFTMSPMEEEMYGVTLGEDYPKPMIDLEASYQRLRREKNG